MLRFSGPKDRQGLCSHFAVGKSVRLFFACRAGLVATNRKRYGRLKPPSESGSYSMKYRFYTCDVFTDQRFGGNPLAVLPEADGLTSEQMQQIAREFNYSESTFVLPAETGHTNRVRIFTPTTEVPFAGHPNIGTAFILSTIGVLGDASTITFEEKGGLVPLTLEQRDGRLWIELKAPQKVNVGATISPERMAEILSLSPEEIVTGQHLPQASSVGLPFLITELRDLDALQRARVRIDKLEELVESQLPADVHLYIHSNDDYDIRARMFAPLDGVPEDPATGSANCALVGLLSSLDSASDGEQSWRIAQGIEMGRPSLLEARTQKRNGEVTGVFIGGSCVMVSEGWIEV